MEQLAFWILSVLAVGSALVVVLHRNPVVCAIALAFHLVSIAGFFMLLNAQFLSFLQVIVYAGAIMVLILFVIMLLNVTEEVQPHPAGSIQRWLAPLGTLAFAVVVGRALAGGVPTSFGEVAAGYGSAAAVGQQLFLRFYYPFEAISLLLVAAMVGAVLLAKRRI